MAIKASKFQAWCVDNITPQSWARICLKCTDILRDNGYNLSSLQNLESDIDLDGEVLDAMKAALTELYDMQLEEDAIAAG